jgi:hypothetical protein
MTTEPIVKFCSARLDERETAARAAADCDGYLEWADSRVLASGDHTIRTKPGSRPIARIRLGDSDAGDRRTLDPRAVAEHIALNDPAHALRDVAAKRAIMVEALNYEAIRDGEWGCGHNPAEIADGSCRNVNPADIGVLRQLAAIDSGHPDYDTAWAPAF